jgi:hypothetical protein
MKNETITTTANRVKAGGYWCEDATAITQAALDEAGLGWDDEIPVSWGFRTLGLANTIMALGSVRPRFQARANNVVTELQKELYTIASKLGEKLHFTFTNVAHWLGNPDRATSRRSQYNMWNELAQATENPTEKSLAQALALLFSAEPPHMACVHASKLILSVTLQIDGQEAATKLRYDIIHFIERELGK